jgi:hypothetical protein
MKVSPRDAVKEATGFFDEFYPGASGARLEEVDLSEEGPWWEVTLSFVADPETSFDAVLGKSNRLFKVVKVDSESGQARGIRVWKQ